MVGGSVPLVFLRIFFFYFKEHLFLFVSIKLTNVHSRRLVSPHTKCIHTVYIIAFPMASSALSYRFFICLFVRFFTRIFVCSSWSFYLLYIFGYLCLSFVRYRSFSGHIYRFHMPISHYLMVSYINFLRFFNENTQTKRHLQSRKYVINVQAQKKTRNIHTYTFYRKVVTGWWPPSFHLWHIFSPTVTYIYILRYDPENYYSQFDSK